MSYTVLSRKYRPQKFNEVVGQQHIMRTLENAIRLDRVAHGYIFSGPRGVGKTTTARILAKALNCFKIDNENPCGQCRNCTELTTGRNMDVLELDGASNRGIDEIRDLREAIKYPPNSGKFRIYIIDEVHMLTKEAFNALLKTLEEPPPHAIFMMATTDPHKVPQTILSRTQRFDFKRVSISDISAHLVDILQREKIQSETTALDLIAQKADGSLRDSLSFLDQVIAFSESKITEEIVREALGIIHDSLFLELIQHIESSQKAEILGTLNKVVDFGHSIPDLITGFNNFLRDMLALSSGFNKNIHISEQCLNWVQNDCSLSEMDFLRIIEITLKFEAKLKFVQQPRIALDSLFIKLASMDSSVSISRVLKGKEDISIPEQKKRDISPQINKPISVPPTPKVTVVKELPPEVAESKKEPAKVEKKDTQAVVVSLDYFENNWGVILGEVEKINPKIIHFLDEAKLESFENSTLNVKLINGHSFQVKSLEKDKAKIEQVVSKIVGTPIRFHFSIDENQTEPINKKKNIADEKDHPLLMKVLEKFEGEILR